MSDDRAEDLTKSADAATGRPEPGAANQQKNEPFKTSPESAPAQTDDDTDANLDDRNGVPVADTHASGGVSEGGVELPSVVPPGKPDGEVDTRPETHR